MVALHTEKRTLSGHVFQFPDWLKNMKMRLPPFLTSYGFSIILIFSLFIGAFLGIVFKQNAAVLKPLGDIFLNLLFTTIVPLVFFSISSAIAAMTNIRRLGKIMSAMILVFVITGLIASLVMMIGVIFYPPAVGVSIDLGAPAHLEKLKTSEQIVKAFTVPDFADIFSKKNMMALIVFSILIGLATSAAGERGKTFSGFFSAGKSEGVRRFWRNIIPPSLIALATGSSIATIPANLQAADKTGVPKDISEFIIPIGATVHMEGSCMAAVLKIAFLFGIFNMQFSGIETILTALGIALLTGVVVSGIPGGGTIGELLIISFYGFPPEALPVIMMIGTLVDTPATMLNAIGDNVSSMLVARILGGKNWLGKT